MKSFSLLWALLLLSDWQKQPSLLWIQVHTRDVLFVIKQFTVFSGSFFKFIAGVFSFRKGYLGQRNETGHLIFSPTAEGHKQKDAYFVLVFLLMFLEKMRRKWKNTWKEIPKTFISIYHISETSKRFFNSEKKKQFCWFPA